MTCPFSSFEDVISASFSLLENLVSVKGVSSGIRLDLRFNHQA
jgi:hypothetical protein